MTTKSDFQQLIKLWFDPSVKPLWYNSTQAFDDQLRDNYLELYNAAKNSELDHWQHTALGALAFVILLDQIPLNIFRGDSESFVGATLACDAAAKAIGVGFDQELSDEKRAFLYLPYMHSENINDQDTAVALYEKASLHDNLKYAKHHRKIIRRFGRFPHRNKILNRANSKAEIDYLSSEAAFLG